MARKSIDELVAQATSDFPDNVAGLITPAKLRQFCLDFLKSMSPGYGVLQKASASTQFFGLAPVVMTWTDRIDLDPTETTSSAATGTIQRSERGTSIINFTADIEAPNGRFVSFTLYKNGLPTSWRITGNGAGSGNPVGVALTAIDYADPAATYDIRGTAEIDGVSVSLSNAAFIVQLAPVKSYT